MLYSGHLIWIPDNYNNEHWPPHVRQYRLQHFNQPQGQNYAPLQIQHYGQPQGQHYVHSQPQYQAQPLDGYQSYGYSLRPQSEYQTPSHGSFGPQPQHNQHDAYYGQRGFGYQSHQQVYNDRPVPQVWQIHDLSQGLLQNSPNRSILPEITPKNHVDFLQANVNQTITSNIRRRNKRGSRGHGNSRSANQSGNQPKPQRLSRGQRRRQGAKHRKRLLAAMLADEEEEELAQQEEDEEDIENNDYESQENNDYEDPVNINVNIPGDTPPLGTAGPDENEYQTVLPQPAQFFDNRSRILALVKEQKLRVTLVKRTRIPRSRSPKRHTVT